jgi:hypothetical protein
MPLEINYRPVILPPGAVPAPRATLACAGPAEERPRDFAARIRKRDVVSVRQTLLRPTGWRAKAGGIAALGALGLVLGSIGWGSPGGIDAAVAQDRIAGLQPFEQAGESFPGSAFYYVSPDDTGLLTPHAAQAAWDAQARAAEPDGDIGPTPLIGPSARPLMARGSSEDRWRALQCLTAAIYYEAASEPDGGQRAVAQVVLNRVAHPAYPKTVCGVVYQGSERPSCQFSFACDGSMARVPMRVFWDRARRVAADALAGYVYAPVALPVRRVRSTRSMSAENQSPRRIRAHGHPPPQTWPIRSRWKRRSRPVASPRCKPPPTPRLRPASRSARLPCPMPPHPLFHPMWRNGAAMRFIAREPCPAAR